MGVKIGYLHYEKYIDIGQYGIGHREECLNTRQGLL
jgi:hypothetical protein